MLDGILNFFGRTGNQVALAGPPNVETSFLNDMRLTPTKPMLHNTTGCSFDSGLATIEAVVVDNATEPADISVVVTDSTDHDNSVSVEATPVEISDGISDLLYSPVPLTGDVPMVLDEVTLAQSDDGEVFTFNDPTFQETPNQGTDFKAGSRTRNSKDDRILGLKSFDKVSEKQLSYLLPDFLLLGIVTVLYGLGGVGKSLLTSFLASLVSTGGKWADGSRVRSGEALFINMEDDPQRTIKPRLKKHDGDLTRIHFSSITIQPQDMASYIRQVLCARPSTKLIVIERVMDSLVSTGVKAAAILGDIQAVCREFNVAVIVLAHTKKTGRKGTVNDLLGTSAQANTVRMAWALEKSDADPHHLTLCNTKNNMGPMLLSHTFRIDEGRIVWERQSRSDDPTLEEVNGRAGANKNEAVEFLRAELTGAGKVKSVDILAAGRREGFTPRQLRVAGQKIGVVISHVKEFGGGWEWELPETSTPRRLAIVRTPA